MADGLDHAEAGDLLAIVTGEVLAWLPPVAVETIPAVTPPQTPAALDLLDAIDRVKTRLQPPAPSVPIRPATHPGL